MSWPENTAFSPTLHALQLAWDSTSLSALKKCPRYYQLSIVEGWQRSARSIDLEFGIAIHSSRECYYRARANSATHEDAVNAALNHALCYNGGEELPGADSAKNRRTLCRALVWYLDRWRDDPLETIIFANGQPAVEVSFRFALGFGPDFDNGQGPSVYDISNDTGGHGEEYLLCGHLDRLTRFAGRTWVSDLKSTRSSVDQFFFRTFSPDNQISAYSLAGKVTLSEKIAGVIIDGVQCLAEGNRFARALVERTEMQLHEWLRSLHAYIRQAERYARDNFWPMNDKACFRCEFRDICSKSPSSREQWLRSDFTKRIWDPLQVRGDV